MMTNNFEKFISNCFTEISLSQMFTGVNKVLVSIAVSKILSFGI